MTLFVHLFVTPFIVVFNCFLAGWIAMKLFGERAGWLVSLMIALVCLVEVGLSQLEPSLRIGGMIGALFVLARQIKTARTVLRSS